MEECQTFLTGLYIGLIYFWYVLFIYETPNVVSSGIAQFTYETPRVVSSGIPQFTYETPRVVSSGIAQIQYIVSLLNNIIKNNGIVYIL
jgi:hypothetical protein